MNGLLIRGIAGSGLIAQSILSAGATGAIAVGSCGAFGTSWNYSSEVLAHGAALTNCPDTSCQVQFTVKNSCAAFALDPNTCAWGANTGQTLQQAEAAALANCNSRDNGACILQTSFCDTSGN